MKPIQPMEPMPLSTFERLRDNNIVQAWLVLILAICFGASLAGIQLTLGPIIEENKINETREKVPELVMGKEAAEKQAASGEALDISSEYVVVEKPGKKTTYNVFQAKGADGKPLGWVAKSGGQGYADRIELLVGMDPEVKQITGIFVLDQKETPGLGNKIVTDEWRGQFSGKAADQALGVKKGGGAGATEINAITGATISSRAVTDIVNAAVADLKGVLPGKSDSGKSDTGKTDKGE